MTIFSLKNSTTSLLLVVAIALSAWSILLSKQNEKVVPFAANQPDAYMENSIATIMNKLGNPSLKIAAVKMVHFVENDKTFITQPQVTVYRQSPAPWFIVSDFAEAINGIEQVIFNNNVKIHHPTDNDNPSTTMLTNSLVIYPSKQEAATNKAITITQPDTIIHAVGMLANLNDGTVKLLSEAKGDYVPHS